MLLRVHTRGVSLTRLQVAPVRNEGNMVPVLEALCLVEMSRLNGQRDEEEWRPPRRRAPESWRGAPRSCCQGTKEGVPGGG